MPRGKAITATHEAYASIERRAAAHLIDLMVAWGLGCVFLFYTVTLAIGMAGESDVGMGIATVVLWLIGYLLYFVVGTMVWSTTIGKFLFGLRVADAATGKDVAPMQAVIRTLMYPISWIPLFLPFLVAVFDVPQRRTIHDHVAGTVVLRDLRRHGRPGFCVLLAAAFVAVIGMTITAFVIGVNS